MQLAEQPSPPVRQDSRWARRITVGLAISLVAIPLLWAAIPAEIARWHQAQAVEAIWAEDDASALESLDEAIRRAPDSSIYITQRAAVLIRLKRFDEAIAECSRVLERDAMDPSALYHRAVAFQRKGEHRGALDDIETVVDLAAANPPIRIIRVDGYSMPVSYEDALNTRAYARALAKVEIEAALDDINTAFERMGQDDIAAYLDTRGYLLYLAGDYQEADDDTQRAVELSEKEWTPQKFEALSEEDTEFSRMVAKQGREELAVLYYHRALVVEALGQQTDAKRYFRLADEFGYDPEEGVW